ncbi:hemerythrin domain-containing protein [Kibdelosporangium philippinense]|uniref:Hemerythrin domain-containing protein n=2 Tax=Kibdelosporangium philippinense TaxID=211113 RepID=A0ABS8Z3W3_9PSEU|nr:hemerythrin domain-containing protein [Kibdelosporangium philippinense]MCE7002609.1 hemerythrin domain-containing protein [Kibdelosporangium philippinense]
MNVDTWEMVVVHKMFRREFALLPGLVCDVTDGDRDRAKLVGDHLAALLRGLHHHHTGEDELLWPKLLDRVSTLDTELVQRMEGQHEAVSGLIERIDALLPRWQLDADRELASELAVLLSDVSHRLNEHLDDEERHVLPLVSVFITEAEWKALGDHGKSGMDKGAAGFVMLGMILEDATPTEKVRFLGLLPPPVRLFHKLIGTGIHRRAKERLHRVAA